MKISKAGIHVLIVFIILVGSVFVDLLNGYFNYYQSISLPLGVAFRTIVTLFSILYVIKLRHVFIYQLYIGLVFGLWICCNLYWIITARHIDPSMEVSLFAKIIYPLFLVCYFSYVIEKNYVSLETILKFTVLNGVISGIFIIFSFFTGLGFNTYAVGETGKSYGFGNSSFFKAQNDVSLAMLISLCFAMYFLFKRRRSGDFIKAFLIAAGLLLIGTRAGLLGALLIVFVYTIYNTFFTSGNTRYGILKKLMIFCMVITVSIFAAIYVIQKIAENPFMLNKYSIEALQGTRATLTEAADTYINKNQQDYLPFLFGSGNLTYTTSLFSNLTNSKGNEADEKTAERDWIDLRGGYGTVFAVSIFLLPVLTFFMSLKYFIGNMRELLRFSMLLAITLFLFHSLFAGHGMKNPDPGTLLAVIYLYAINNKFFINRYKLNNQ